MLFPIEKSLLLMEGLVLAADSRNGNFRGRKAPGYRLCARSAISARRQREVIQADNHLVGLRCDGEGPSRRLHPTPVSMLPD